MVGAYPNLEFDGSMTSTTFTFGVGDPVCLELEPNLDHPIFADDLDRVKGIEAAINYLYKKGLYVDDGNIQLYRLKQ